MKEAIGITRQEIKAGETIALINLGSLKVTSNNIKFLPWGKQKLLKEILVFKEHRYGNSDKD